MFIIEKIRMTNDGDGSFGGGQVAMCNEPMGSDLVLGWPTAQIGLMSAEGAVDILYRREIASSPDPENLRKRKIEEYKQTIGKEPFHSAAMGFVEELIDPRQTRPLLVKALRRLTKKREGLRPWKKHGNMPL